MIKFFEKFMILTGKIFLKVFLFMFTTPFVILFILFVFSIDAMFTSVRKRK